MRSIRHHLLQHRASAALVLTFALLMRILVPAGFMPVTDHGSIAIVICTGHAPVPMAMTPSHRVMTHMSGMAMPDAGHHPANEHQDKVDAPCLFSGLAAPLLAGADPVLLAAALLFVLLLAVRTAVRPPVMPAPRLRPPLRGPPFRC